MEELKVAYTTHDSTLLSYAQLNPNSYLALWTTIELCNFGYEPIYHSLFNSFSQRIQHSQTGVALKRKLDGFKSLTGINEPFPDISCMDRNSNLMPKHVLMNHRFTLVDFWYSECAPCLAQFDDLKKVYADFHEKGLEIIGISVDARKYIPAWKHVINIRKLIWPQYLDLGGAQARRLNIGSYPTNFLLNKDGKIIAKNLSPIELRKTLTQERIIEESVINHGIVTE